MNWGSAPYGERLRPRPLVGLRVHSRVDLAHGSATTGQAPSTPPVVTARRSIAPPCARVHSGRRGRLTVADQSKDHHQAMPTSSPHGDRGGPGRRPSNLG